MSIVVVLDTIFEIVGLFMEEIVRGRWLLYVAKLAFGIMKHVLGVCLAIIMLLIVGPVESSRAAPITPSISVKIIPSEVVPAQAGYIYIGGGYPLQVLVSLDDRPLTVFWSGSGYIALFSFDFDEPPGTHQVITRVFDPVKNLTFDQTDTISVLDFKYQSEQVAVPYRLAPLLDPELNQNEISQLSALYAQQTRPSYLDWPFGLPVPGGIVTSRFGGNRVYNGGILAAHHTGVDFRRATGEPVHATADGRVVAARLFDVRGNVIILDHGYGVFSQYAHLSKFEVKVGQYVQRDQVIGAAGATGRVNGPHLHFEIIVNGAPVNPIQWFALAPSFVPPREFVPEHDQPGENPSDG